MQQFTLSHLNLLLDLCFSHSSFSFYLCWKPSLMLKIEFDSTFNRQSSLLYLPAKELTDLLNNLTTNSKHMQKYLYSLLWKFPILLRPFSVFAGLVLYPSCYPITNKQAYILTILEKLNYYQINTSLVWRRTSRFSKKFKLNLMKYNYLLSSQSMWVKCNHEEEGFTMCTYCYF